MSADITSVTREIDASGRLIKGFSDASLRVAQAIVIDPEVGAGLLTRFITQGTGERSILVDDTARRVYQVDVVTAVGATDPSWLMVFDKATAAIAADIPVHRARVAGGFASIDLGFFGIELALGLAVALSTTPGPLTLGGGANDGFFQVGWA